MRSVFWPLSLFACDCCSAPGVRTHRLPGGGRVCARCARELRELAEAIETRVATQTWTDWDVMPGLCERCRSWDRPVHRFEGGNRLCLACAEEFVRIRGD